MVSGKQGMKLEVFKFGVYIGIPVVASALFNEPETVRWFVDYFRFVEYPAPASSNPEIVKQLEEQTKQRKLLRTQREEYKKQLGELDRLVASRNEIDENHSQNRTWWYPW